MGGLLSCWIPRVVQLRSYKTDWGILLEGDLRLMDKYVTFLNMYAPYKNRESFWVSLSDYGILKIDNLILEGDLNFTTSTTEIWDQRKKLT